MDLTELINPILPEIVRNVFSRPPENIRKSLGFLMFSEVRERVHWERMS